MDSITLTNEELLKELASTQRELDELRRSNEKKKLSENADATLATILESLPDMILRVDTDMKVVWANKAALHKVPNVIGQACYKAYMGYDKPCEGCPCAEALRTGKIVQGNISLPKKERSDEVAYWENIGIPTLDRNGQVNGVIEISRDVTDRVKFEQKLSEYTQALEDSKRVSDQASQMKTKFISDLSHELRTPMNGLMGMIQLLEKTDLSPRQREYIEVITASSRKMMHVLASIVENASLEAGQVILVNDAFQMRSVYDELINVYSKQAHDKGLRFKSRFDPDIPHQVLGDVKRLRQALINILENGIKFTESGRVEFNIDLVGETSDTVELSISVRDTGIGISSSQQEAVMGGSAESGSALESSGIGLAISKQIVELMGGELKLISEQHRGTEVVINLSFDRVQNVEVKPRPAPAHSRQLRSKKRILIAEDEVIGRVTMKLMLKDRYELIFAKNGDEAVDMYFEYEPDLVLMDILMPEMNGFEAFDEIEKKSLSRVPVIACTAKVISTEKEYLTSYGFDDYLSKPIDVQQLRELLDRYL